MWLADSMHEVSMPDAICRPHLLIFELAKAEVIGDGASEKQASALMAELGSLGTILGMDVLLNNWDRLPLIW